MSAIDITEKSEELKNLVSQFETTLFLGNITSLMHIIPREGAINPNKGLSSPQRQLSYLAALNITSDPSKISKADFSQEEFNTMKRILGEIEIGYEQFFYPKPEDVVDEEWILRRKVAMPYFLDYFNQGTLNYDEQVIERIEEYFEPFDNDIHSHFGLYIKDVIDIYNFIDSIPNKFLMEKINKKEGQQTWEEFAKEMQTKGIMPWEMQEHMPMHLQEFSQWMYDKGRMQRFSKQNLIENFDPQKVDAFLNIFTCNRLETNFLYYTEKNPIHQKPIFKIDGTTYQFTSSNILVQAIYVALFNFCTGGTLGDRFYKNRGIRLEQKIEHVFNRFFKNKAASYRGYYTQDGKGQDLLFIHQHIALIIEAKSSKKDEPRREPDKAYPLILINFDEVIQKGYDQAYRVKTKFLDREPIEIYKDQACTELIRIINTRHFKAFSIIVTLERFGQIQTDLTYLLDIYDDDDYPLSICIDDLEILLLQMEKLNMDFSELKNFLYLREQLHGRLITSDELEVGGAYITNKLRTKEVAHSSGLIKMHPDFADIFDKTYQTKGLGFDKEKNLDIKTSGKYIPLY
jgi:hypothetical protein